jgi:pimeloyl-ACP methyl ester carboxylesterase
MGGGTRIVQVDEGPIAYEQAGDGPPLVLLHGAYVDSGNWAPQLESLARDFTVVAWDAPGCGGSFDPPPDYGLAGYADCLIAFVAALGLERPHLCGLSFGSSVALEASRRHPGLPRGLVLASAFAGWAGSLGRSAAEERRAEFLADADRGTDEARASGIRAIGNALADADLRDGLPHIDAAVLLIYGEDDDRSPVSVGEDLNMAIPGSKLVVIPGAGHSVNLDAPQRFDQEVRSFLMA